MTKIFTFSFEVLSGHAKKCPIVKIQKNLPPSLKSFPYNNSRHLTSFGMKGVKKQSNILNMENVKLESMVDTISFMLWRRNSMAGWMMNFQSNKTICWTGFGHFFSKSKV